MDKIKTIFIGTAEIGSPLLKTLAKDERFEISLVITQADKPAGRKMELQPSPIKQVSKELGLSIFQPENINQSAKEIKEHNPDILLVFAYGQILRREILDIPTFGCLNIHTSLLPKYRGASPIQSSILNGDKETGVSLMKMDEEMDLGPVYASFQFSVPSSQTTPKLHDDLAKLSAEKIPDAIYTAITEDQSPTPQNEDEATYCKKITKADGQINWNEEAETIDRKIRAYAGWPGSYTFFEDKRLKILKATPITSESATPGEVIEKESKVFIGTQKGVLQLFEVQMEGKKPQLIEEFIKGYNDFIGSSMN